MNNLKALISASVLIATLAGCGGGDSGGGSDAAGTPGTDGTPTASGVVTGSISSIVGSYSVKVVKFDCDPISTSDLTVAPQADGSCKITNPLFTQIRRNILPEGAYTLKITTDGAIEMLQGTASKVKINCPPSPGVCRVDAIGTTIYTYAIGSGSAGPTPASVASGISQLEFNVAGTKISFIRGLLATLNTNVNYTSANTLGNGETGVLDIEPN